MAYQSESLMKAVQLSAATQAQSLAYAPPNLCDRVSTSIERKKEELAQLEELHSLLESNPEFERIFTLLSSGNLW